MLLFISSCFFGFRQLNAQNNFDSLKIKPPKHYFNTLIVIDTYNKPEKKIDTNNAISKQLQTYGIRQRNFAFQIPILTRDIKTLYADCSIIANHHLLLRLIKRSYCDITR